MKQVLKALERNETVSALYRGKRKGAISPATTTPAVTAKEHCFFGCQEDTPPVADVMQEMRGGRHRRL